jgi:uncharacterized metal-binding protein
MLSCDATKLERISAGPRKETLSCDAAKLKRTISERPGKETLSCDATKLERRQYRQQTAVNRIIFCFSLQHPTIAGAFCLGIFPSGQHGATIGGKKVKK